MMIKHILAPLALISLPLLISAQDLPTMSPSATVQQRIGLSDITITYSRPSMKGRKIFGDLVPLNEMWRAGANKSTTFVTTGLLYIDGHKLPPGKYSLFAVPAVGAWELVFNSNTELWGTDGYKPEEDVLRVKAATRAVAPTETFTIGFDNLSMDKGDLVLRWETQEAFLPIESNSTEQGLANIRTELAKPEADFRAYARSASFCLERGVEPKSAFEWANKSVNMEKKYWNMFTLAKAQAGLDMYTEAISTGKQAIALATMEKDAGAEKSYQEKVDEWTAKSAGK